MGVVLLVVRVVRVVIVGTENVTDGTTGGVAPAKGQQAVCERRRRRWMSGWGKRRRRRRMKRRRKKGGRRKHTKMGKQTIF